MMAAQAHPIRILVLLSGNGSNFQALLHALSPPVTPDLTNTAIVHVISNRKAAYGLTRAATASIPTTYHNLVSGGYRKAHPNNDQAAREAYDADLAKLILEQRPDLVACLGWMHVLSESFLTPLRERGVPIINLHPALPGEYNGAEAIRRAYDDFKEGKITRTGCMIHYVIAEVDMGEAIATEEVPILLDDTLETLEERMHQVEHELVVKGTSKAIAQLREAKT